MAQSDEQSSEGMISHITAASILVCQTVFVSIVLTCVALLTGLLDGAYDLAVIGGILIFNAVWMYQRAVSVTQTKRHFIKITLLGFSTIVAAAGIAISVGLLHSELALALKPLPFLIVIPMALAYLATKQEAAGES